MTRPGWLSWPGPRVNATRWVVLDVETTGLDPQRDELVCVAALAMTREQDRWALVAHDSFESVLQRQRVNSPMDNVLLHGVGWGARDQGDSPREALQALSDWIKDSPVIAFHADFDRRFIQEACRHAGLPAPRWPWLDLADVLPVVFGKSASLSLDAWMGELQVPCHRRHEAAADVWSTAQLWLKASCHVQGHARMQWRDWQACARQVRWMPSARTP